MLKRSLIVLVSAVGLIFSGMALQPASVYASTPQQEVCRGVGAATGTGCSSGVSLTTVIRNIINVFSIIIGIVAVVMIMVAGFKYITAAGDSGNITSAKQTLIYAIVGLVVTALSQFIVHFVLDTVSRKPVEAMILSVL